MNTLGLPMNRYLWTKNTIVADPDKAPQQPSTRVSTVSLTPLGSMQAGSWKVLLWPNLLLVAMARLTAGCRWFLTKSSDSTLSKLLAPPSISSVSEELMVRCRYINFNTVARKG